MNNQSLFSKDEVQILGTARQFDFVIHFYDSEVLTKLQHADSATLGLYAHECGFSPPRAPQWYRFVLAQSAVTVALMAPDDREQLEEDLSILDDWHALSQTEYAALRAHGDRVHRHADGFP